MNIANINLIHLGQNQFSNKNIYVRHILDNIEYIEYKYFMIDLSPVDNLDRYCNYWSNFCINQPHIPNIDDSHQLQAQAYT